MKQIQIVALKISVICENERKLVGNARKSDIEKVLPLKIPRKKTHFITAKKKTKKQ